MIEVEFDLITINEQTIFGNVKGTVSSLIMSNQMIAKYPSYYKLSLPEQAQGFVSFIYLLSSTRFNFKRSR